MQESENTIALLIQRRTEFIKLSKDPSYCDIHFNETNGALRATHIDHHFDREKGHYEKEVVTILYNNNHKIILASEKNEEGIKTPDGTLNDSVFEIKTVEGTGSNNIKNKFSEARSQGCSHIILYFPDPLLYSHHRIREGYNRYKGVIRKEKLHDPLEKIWIVKEDAIKIFK